MMKKKIILLFLAVLLIPFSFGMRTCQDVIEANTDCEILTPITTCGTYDLYNSSHDLIIDDGVMSQIGATGVYNFTFNQANEGTYKVITCANDTTTIEVAGYSLSNIYIEAQDDATLNLSGANLSVSVNSTDIANAVWDLNLSARYPQAENDNYIANLAGERVVQSLRFIIQLLFG